MANNNQFVEQGTNGVPQWNGRYADRYLEVLRGPAGILEMDKILRQETAAFTLNNAVLLSAKQAKWTATGASDKPADRRAAEFIDQCFDDMSKGFGEAVEFALSGTAFGFSTLHPVLKRRLGRMPGGNLPSSKYSDGRVGIRKLAIRRQETIDHWVIDENGDPNAMVQFDPVTGKQYPPVPIERLLHFRFGNARGAWEGAGWLELAYKPFHMIQNLEIIYGIGQQRAHTGLPVFPLKGKPTPNDMATIERIGRSLVVNEQQFVIYPESVTDFKLESVQNHSAAETREMINECRWQILSLMLGQFLRLGNTDSGSRALADPLVDMFLLSIDSANRNVADVLSDHLIPRLMAANPGLLVGLTDYPRATPSSVANLPVATLTFLDQIGRFLSTAGQEDSDWLRGQIRMPLVTVDDNPPPSATQDDDEDSGQNDGQDQEQDEGANDAAQVDDSAQSGGQKRGQKGSDKDATIAAGASATDVERYRLRKASGELRRAADALAGVHRNGAN